MCESYLLGAVDTVDCLGAVGVHLRVGVSMVGVLHKVAIGAGMFEVPSVVKAIEEDPRSLPVRICGQWWCWARGLGMPWRAWGLTLKPVVHEGAAMTCRPEVHGQK